MALPPLSTETVEEAAHIGGRKKTAKAFRAGWRLTRGERFRYYLGDAGWLVSTQVLATFLTIFLVLQGMSLAAVGTLILVVKLIDAADDLVFGYLIDRLNPSRVRWLQRLSGTGKYLPWYRVSFFWLPITTILFFVMPSDMPEIAKIIWFGVAYLLYDLATTVSQVPINSMVVSLTDNVNERDAMLRVRGLMVVLFVVAAAIVWQFLISEFVGLPVVGVAVGSAIIGFFLMLPLARGVKEHNVELKNAPEEAAPKYTLREMGGALRTNKYMMLLLSGDIVKGLLLTQNTTAMFAAFFLFNNSMILTLPLVFGLLPALVLQFFADRIVHKLGKRNTLLLAALPGIVSGTVMFLLGPDNAMLVVVLTMLAAIPNGLLVVVTSFMVPDTIEYTRYKTGQDCAGIFYALMSFVQKAASGVSAAFAMFILGLGGWVAVTAADFGDLAAQGVTQPPSALFVLWLTISLIPALGGLLYAVIIAFYRLRDGDARLMARSNAGEITRAECEAQLSRSY